MSGASITFDAVSARVGETTFQFSFARQAGSITPVLGASGSGKSTLLNLLAGFVKPLSGKITISGRDVTDVPPGARGISMVFQDNNLFAHLRIAENVGLGLDPALRLNGEQKRAVEAALARVGLEGFGSRMPGSLSGGERQRVALARAFVRRSPILALDEPFTGLGPGLSADMLDLMLDLHRETGFSILFITHYPDEALKTGGTALFLGRGGIVADEDVRTLFDRRDIDALSRWLGKE